jgi:hypothetical protein
MAWIKFRAELRRPGNEKDTGRYDAQPVNETEEGRK